jgi:hypothetical protein
MAAKSSRILLFIALVIAAGIGAFIIARSRLRHSRLQEAERFVSTYVALSIAHEKYRSQPESLQAAYAEIYQEAGADSAWMFDFTGRLALDPARGEIIWSKIVRSLDSLRGDTVSYD